MGDSVLDALVERIFPLLQELASVQFKRTLNQDQSGTKSSRRNVIYLLMEQHRRDGIHRIKFTDQPSQSRLVTLCFIFVEDNMARMGIKNKTC